jgi:hypothetical protein
MDTLAQFDQGLHYDDLHNDHKDWISELEFSLKELDFFENLLGKHAADHGANAWVEQIQNKIILHRENIEIYIHDLRAESKKLTRFVKEHPISVEFATFQKHNKWREKMEDQRRSFAEMKTEFYKIVTEKK